MPRLISQEQKDRVLHLRFEKEVENVAEIVRQVGISRSTVDKIIRGEEKKREKQPARAQTLVPGVAAPEVATTDLKNPKPEAVTAPPAAIQVPALEVPPPKDGANRQGEDRMYAVVRAGFSALGKDPKSRRQGLKLLISEADKLGVTLERQRGVISQLQEKSRGIEEQLEEATRRDQELAEACRILMTAMRALLAQEIEAMRSSNSA
ncbi:MAG: hypothetical protein HYT49_03610 [Candidatus Wildermuthbacteria bacterium]|nr:hypothetical protein [Candidatus Wildermuthbacteria bacterium]